MTIYATAEQLATHMGAADPPTDADVLLRIASSLVDGQLTARFGVDADGWPVRDDQRDAVRDATLAQAEAWSINGIDPRKGAAQLKRGVKSKALTGGPSVTYDDAAGQGALQALAAGTSLTDAAWGFLYRAGLTSGRVYRGPADRDVYVYQTPYDLTTGALE